jgi:hypothetical protein
MSRAAWFVVGAGAGVYAVLRGRRAAEALSVDGLGDRINAAALGARMFRDEVLRGAAEKDTELRSRLAAAPAGRPALRAAEQPAHPLHDQAPDHPTPSTTDTEEGST